jgi:hypothetical protein
METNNQNSRDPHQEFMEWIAAIVGSLPGCPAGNPEVPSTSDEEENIIPAK